MRRCLAIPALMILPVMIWVDEPVAAWVATQPARLAGGAAPFPVALVLFGAALAGAATLLARKRPRGLADAVPLPGRTATLVVISAAASLGSACLLKHLIGRTRPSAAGAGSWRFEPLAFDDRFAALPSAHAACVAAIVLSLAVRLPRWRVPLVVGGAAACLHRVLAGAHWPSDVIAGWGLGAAMVLVTQFGLIKRQARLGSRRG